MTAKTFEKLKEHLAKNDLHYSIEITIDKDGYCYSIPVSKIWTLSRDPMLAEMIGEKDVLFFKRDLWDKEEECVELKYLKMIKFIKQIIFV